MISDELRKKLEALNRGPLTAEKSPVKGAAKEPDRVSLEHVVKGRVVGAPERPCFLVERVLAEIFAPDRASALEREFLSVWTHGRHALSDADRERDWPEIVAADPSRLLFLDIETCGLASTPVFLVGVMHLHESGAFHLRQFFARDYAEERHVQIGRASWRERV